MPSAVVLESEYTSQHPGEPLKLQISGPALVSDPVGLGEDSRFGFSIRESGDADASPGTTLWETFPYMINSRKTRGVNKIKLKNQIYISDRSGT